MEKELIEDQEHRRKKCECVVTLFYPCCVSPYSHFIGAKLQALKN